MRFKLFAARYKLTIVLLLIATFALIFSKNLIDRNHSKNLAVSFSSIYEDRLLVEGYIFEIANLMHHKKTVVTGSLSQSNALPTADLSKADERIRQLIGDYGKTKFTAEEWAIFNGFKNGLSQILAAESMSSIDAEHLFEKYEKAMLQLKDLSGIQLAEAGKLNRESQQIFSGSSLLTEVEFVILILSCIAIQLLLATGGDRPKFPFNAGLN